MCGSGCIDKNQIKFSQLANVCRKFINTGENSHDFYQLLRYGNDVTTIFDSIDDSCYDRSLEAHRNWKVGRNPIGKIYIDEHMATPRTK